MLSEMHFTGTWRDYQARVLEEMDEHLEDGRLHLVAAPGAGKTVLGLEIIRRIGRSAIVFAPTRAIRDQWAQRLFPLFLKEPASSQGISHDLMEPAELTLLTYQSLVSNPDDEEFEQALEVLRDRGPLTLVLDEAHHLRREWWRRLDRMAATLEDLRIVALTATPPYDASFAEWGRYEALCGPIDLEIGIPELVRNGDLCPHQDHILFSEPTRDGLEVLALRREAIGRLVEDLRQDFALLDFLARHPWLIEPEAHADDILERPELLSAALVHLRGAKRDIPARPLKLLGVGTRELPVPSPFWFERLLEGLLEGATGAFDMGPAWTRALKRKLDAAGLIEGGRVRLTRSRQVFKVLVSSLAKLESIARIVEAEAQALGENLRMVILSDHIRANELPGAPDAFFQPTKLGIVPIFETLRREGTRPDKLGVLTGSLVIVPRSALDAARRLAAEHGLESEDLCAQDLPGCPDHLRLTAKGPRSGALLAIVTALFRLGAIRILVGTQSLLGEGWDAPSLNSLVLASNTASYMLSNQMRGRAIRKDPEQPDKVANIWHLATLAPPENVFTQQVSSRLDWGYLFDGEQSEQADAVLLDRRFRAFEGITNDPRPLIENGLSRLGCELSAGVEKANIRTLTLARDRGGIAQQWSTSLGEGDARSHVRETAAANYAPQRLAWRDTAHAMAWSGLGAGLLAGAGQLRGVDNLEIAATLGMVALGVATLASLPRLGRAARLLWRNGTLERSLVTVGKCLLETLHHTGHATELEMKDAAFRVRTSLDGRKDVIVSGVRRTTERQLMQALCEILGPVQNPRYVLTRKSWIGRHRRQDYHAVPALLAARKEDAEAFCAAWNRYVGSSALIFTRTPKGRRMLLKARAQSFAAGFQRQSERRSVWL